MNSDKLNPILLVEDNPSDQDLTLVNFEKFLDVAGYIDLYWRIINKTP